MSSKIAVMADEDTVTGFMLGGIKQGYTVGSKEEAEQKLGELIAEDFSIIITTEKIGTEIRSTINKVTGEHALPMIIEVPDKEGSMDRELDPLRELIKRVIGVEMVK